ncbi:MAG: hypothetical protein QNJ63_13120 [Calothrix sp. MO_192.B10]|nr:hypothetical protein [Calothrix sp. MO_192.B10]
MKNKHYSLAQNLNSSRIYTMPVLGFVPQPNLQLKPQASQPQLICHQEFKIPDFQAHIQIQQRPKIKN